MLTPARRAHAPPRLPVSLALAAMTGLAACGEPLPPAAPRPDAAAPAVSLAVGRGGPSDQPFLQGRVIARFRPGAERAETLRGHGATVQQSLLLERMFVLQVAAGRELAVAEALARNPNIEFATPDYLYAIIPCGIGGCDAPNDGFFSRRWDLHNPGVIRVGSTVIQLTGLADADIDWLEMYDFLGPSFGGTARIGIIDTGIRGTHVDLNGRVLIAQNFAAGYPATLTEDRNGHGTHVAGIAAARGQDGIGVPGVAYGPNIRLINAKACEFYLFPDGTVGTACASSSIANAIVWAVDQGANVLNLSLGGPAAATEGDPAQQLALQYARAHNVLPLCATGNENFAAISFPARFPECAAVGATNWSNLRASYSNYGEGIDLSAPGGDVNPLGTPNSFILSSYVSATNPLSNTTYAFAAGTSMASPQVAGLAALLYARGMTDPAAVLERLQSTADDLGDPGWDQQFGAGKVNAYRAITGYDPAPGPIAVPIPPVNGTGYVGQEGSAVQFDGRASHDPHGDPLQYAWNFGDGETATGATPTHAYADEGTYTVTLTVTDLGGLTDTKSTTATVANVAPTVEMTLGAATILSGQTVSLAGSFSDPGTLDDPWSYAIDWGNGTTAGTLPTQATAIAESRRYCAAGGYTITLSVTDEDGGTGSKSASLTVTRNGVAVSLPASIYLGQSSSGLIPVAILGTASFDAATVNPASATLGNGSGAEAAVAVRTNGSLSAALEDVNKDGRADLTLQFERDQLVGNGDLTQATTQLVVLATLRDGCVQVRGAATVKVVP